MVRIKFLYIAIIIFVFYSCGHRTGNEVSMKLQQWDTEISNRNYCQGDPFYDAIFDSLRMIVPEDLSSMDEALYCLLHTCLSDKLLKDFSDDSIISVSVKTYGKEKDVVNLFRSMVYQGVVRYRIDDSDTTSFLILKEAERLASLTNDDEGSLFRMKGLLYGTLGRILENEGNSLSAGEYLKKGMGYYQKCGDLNNYIVDRLELAWSEMNYMHYDEVEKTLSDIDTTAIPDYLKSAVYNTYSTIYHEQKLYKKSIDFRKKQMAIDRKLGGDADISDLYSLSCSYLYVHPDSAMSYSSKMLELTGPDDSNVSYYYQQFAEVAASTGRYRIAYDSLLLSWHYLENKIDEASAKKIEELEKKYNYSKFELLAERERSHKNLSIWIFSSVFIILAAIIFFIIYRVTYVNRLNKTLLSQRDKLHSAYSVMMKNISTIPDMVNKTDALSSKYVSDSNVSKDLNVLSCIFRSNYKKGLSELSSALRESHSNQNIDFSSLSDKEIIIFCLSQDGYSSREIAKMMCISDGNVRATLKKTREKL